MSALSKIDNKLVFASGNRPSETDFSNLVDSYTQFSELLEFIGTAISNQTGILEVVSASATTHAVLPLDKGGTGEASLASAQNALATGGFAVLASANTFTNNNTFTQNVAVSGDVNVSALEVRSDLVVSGAIYSVSASGGAQGANTINVSEIYDDGERVEATVLDTEQATTTGSSFTFTSPFATTTRIIVMLEGVSVNDTDALLIQLGDSGGVETTGYVSTSTAQLGAGGSGGDEIANSASTSGFVMKAFDAADTWTGTMTIVLSNSTNNTWISSHAGKLDAANTAVGGGQKDLSGVLTTVTLLDVGGDDFDAGAINVRWYGY